MKLHALAVMASTTFAFVTPAFAEDDPSVKALAAIEAPILDILKAKPDAASDACIAALKELHATQKAIGSGQYDDNPSDYAIAHDVLQSDFENSIQICGADARRVCRASAATDADSAARCNNLSRAHPA